MAYVEISHTPSRRGWNSRKLDTEEVPEELKTGKTLAISLPRNRFMDRSCGFFSISDDDLKILQEGNLGGEDFLETKAAKRARALYENGLKKAGIPESKAPVIERILSAGVDVFFG